ncbi:phosphoadenosine phosphosulfate reductase family protein [Galbibacter pacificus]|uniref:Phosphoadenosine phosphosulfate reductase family protein n=1 Tax=Galbibacter pacificus TaxID=2996052 RepID=A0ABT6FM92_9FLAO|nr:phosphoadenosine phosphosulfate reductase family protein [Galbibacter pacificus]MDG3580909.1 phosphoadenosine phosphosulfate reductase family protein [Galbibacter pacificus]MDG3584387.1 phosphoadenosine phosphosulfate reductase family protein [Galbibacter pacificus]
MNLKEINKELSNKTPEEIVAWAIEQAKKPVVTTNFRPYEASILHATTSIKKDIPVIWCDTGYNTNKTYLHAERLIDALQLQIKLYVPRQTSAYRDAVMGIPHIDSPQHKIFTEQVKLEPFRRAMEENKPDVWFTNLRKGQTAFRDTLDIVTQDDNGVLKVSPFFYWTDEELDAYLEEHNLENEFKYFDPTKVLDNRECGLHVS